MELHYRGSTYNHDDLNVEMADSGIVAHYRGAAAKLRQPKRNLEQHPPQRLKYRGAWVK
ncbi:DUF4278 domain-containing protein [Egbenema bharatensis]|uniref:DUF4278 domain-containing protein n=1 Tax=Egbenema bharatensis TaxID=3463334 RepID=UPI003A8C842A